MMFFLLSEKRQGCDYTSDFFAFIVDAIFRITSTVVTRQAYSKSREIQLVQFLAPFLFANVSCGITSWFHANFVTAR